MTSSPSGAVRRHDVLIVGAGNAGISLAAKLCAQGARDVAIIDARRVHRYRPLLSYVGGGQASPAAIMRPQREVIPAGVRWYEEDAIAVDPASRSVRTTAGRTIEGRDLVLCPGVRPDWGAVAGSEAAVHESRGASNYVDERAPHTWELIRGLRRGTAVFAVGEGLVPCAGVGLKPLFLAADHWRREGVLADVDIHLVVAWPTIWGHPRVDAELEAAARRFGITVHTGTRLIAIDAQAHRITLTGAGPNTAGESTLDYDLLHLAPTHRAPAWVADSGLADPESEGTIAVDPRTLAHRAHARVWGLGDAADVRTSRSGGALRKQVAVLAENIARARTRRPLLEYDGYSVAPVTTSRRALSVIEVDRSGELVPSLPFVDTVKPRLAWWLYDRYLQPQLYWRGILKGRVSV